MISIDIHRVNVAICDNRDQWLLLRRNGIGASESAAIFGVGYASQSPLTVWQSKVSDVVEEFDESSLRLMARGSRMEPVIAAEFEDETGLACEDPGDYTIFWHAEVEWMFATLDRVCVHPEFGPIPVELKNVSGRMRHEWDDEIEPPLKFQVQCQHQMAVTDASHCYLVGLIGGDDLKIRLIERNDKFIDVMIKRLGEFWEHVKSNTMPPVDDSEATAKMIAKHWPHDSGEEFSLPDESADWDAELAQAKADIKDAQGRKTAAENKIKAAIGENTWGVLPDGSRYSWKSQSRAEHVVRASEFRVLRRSK